MSGSAFILILSLAQFGQSNTGELRVTVTDLDGLPLESSVELISDANGFRQSLQTDQRGIVIAKRLPFGTYRVAVTRDGFGPFAGLIDVRSALPTEYHVTLSIAPVQTEITVRADDTLLDVHRSTTVQRLGGETLQRRTSSLPGRSLPDLVNSQPGWLLEANGVLHPRGSEYQTQYVVDGLPLTDNRSPAFAPEIDADDVRTIGVLTGGYPAEYGRKLGGVIEVVTGGEARRGLHGSVAASIGSFNTKGANAIGEYAWPRTTLSATAGLTDTERYLDPPVEQNYTNRGTISHYGVRFEHDATDADRLGAIVRHGQANFLVPNEQIQQEAGQRQDRRSDETAGQFSYQRVFSAHVLADVRGMARTVSAGLWSNAAAIPIAAEQDRGFRELYVKGSLAAHFRAHELKFGADLDAGNIRERFGYQITDPSRFDPDVAPIFAFTDRQPDREHALFVQDQIGLGRVTVNAGVRWDRYRLVVDEAAVSPRLGVAWSWPAADLVLRASYDRAFQTPAVENLLLASSPAVESLSDTVIRLPVPPSRGNFYEGGVSKALFAHARLDASYFARTMLNAADDDLLLNTGVSFPIAFRRADIHGAEIKLDVPHWNAFSGSISYGYMRGTGVLPITGGLFLGAEGASLLESTDSFPVTQDQRHTVRGRLIYQLPASAWVGLAAAYGSGLPFEFAGDREEAIAQYGERIVDQVNFETGRVNPSFSMDASGGFLILRNAKRSLRVQADVRNLTNRLTVINFAGLFSGTALAPPRSVAVRLQAGF
ncbi:MAG: TonB-dependent receptor [Blastocatellia bacterium]|nr:MAG: TonB-dependent receptor [Blastocatellia bacterium]